MRSELGWEEFVSISTVSGSPLVTLTSLWSRISYPASRISFSPSRRLLRTAAGESNAGLLYGVVNTSGGTLSRSGSRIVSCSPSGMPLEARSVPSK